MPEVWTRKCPICQAVLTKPHPLDPWWCHACGWKSNRASIDYKWPEK